MSESQTTQVGLRLPKELYAKLKVYCAMRGISCKTAITEALNPVLVDIHIPEKFKKTQKRAA